MHSTACPGGGPRVHVFLALSLDGCIAGEGGDLSWLAAAAAEPTALTGYDALMQRVDALLIGRRTYDAVLGFPEWPYAGKQVHVLTHRALTSHHGEMACQGPLDRVLAALRESGVRELYLDGGDVVRQGLALDCIDELTLSWVPVVVGRGTRLFDGPLPQRQWHLLATRAFPSGMVQARYQRFSEGSVR